MWNFFKMILSKISFALLCVLISNGLADIPDCNYEDTVDLTNKTYTNGSYEYDGRLIPANLTGEFTYKIIEGKNETVPPYRRGCIPKKEELVEEGDMGFNPYIQSASIVFMILAIAIHRLYLKIRTVHGKCCTLYFTCLTVSYLLKIVDSTNISYYQIWLCRANGYIGYFAVMSAFLWLCIVSYDLFMGTTGRRGSRQNEGKRRFINYNCIVWITGTLLTIIIVVVDEIEKPLDHWKEAANWFTPNVGLFGCWISTDKSNGNGAPIFYFFGPMLILILFNIILFFLTTGYVYFENRKNRSVLNKIGTQTNQSNQVSFAIYVRLMVIMGVTWILEIVAYSADNNESTVWTTVSLISGLVTSAQGILIFLVTILNKHFIKSVKQSFPRHFRNESNTMHSQQTTENTFVRNYSQTSHAADTRI